MSLSARDKAALLDIRRAALKASEKPAKYTWEDFAANDEIQSSAMHWLTVLGEAVKRLSHDFRQAYPNIDWRKIAGLRDVIVHEYDDIDLELIWKVLSDDMTALESVVSGILQAQGVPIEEEL